MRAAALRTIGNDKQYVRTTEYVMPFVSLVPATAGDREGTMFIAVPMDDVTHMLFWGLWGEDKPCEQSPERVCAEPRDLNNYALINGSKHDVWQQDRAAMASGHFTGFDKCLLDEDMVVQASMGAITDRTQEQLAPADLAVVRARTRLLNAVAAFEDGRLPDAAIPTVRPVDLVIDRQHDWREFGGTAPSLPPEQSIEKLTLAS